MQRTLLLVILLATLFVAGASAAPILISGNGTFSASTPTRPFSGASETWAFSFLVDSDPVVSNVTLGQDFDVAFSNFSYDLNGSPVAITPAEIRFISNAGEGMFLICFPSACGPTSGGLALAGPQMYSGLESAPTILTGNFTSTAFDVFTGTVLYTQPNVTVQALASAPEPMTLPLMGAGLLGLGFLRLLSQPRTHGRPAADNRPVRE